MFYLVWYTLINALTIFAFRLDKKRAQKGEWRIPEKRLHLLELLGGWPGAIYAIRHYRHKSSKLTFRIITFFMILLHLYALELIMR